MKDFSIAASDEMLRAAVEACTHNGLHAHIAEDSEQAKKIVLDTIPKNAEVFTMTSRTLEQTGIAAAINKSGEYDSVREKFSHMDPRKQHKEMKRLGAAPDWTIGSVHAATTDGHLFIASNTGSQLAAEVYGAENVIYVVGIQKIVKDDAEAKKRIYEYVLPLEDTRAMQAYGTHSFVSKLLTINREVESDRIRIIFVKEPLGF